MMIVDARSGFKNKAIARFIEKIAKAPSTGGALGKAKPWNSWSLGVIQGSAWLRSDYSVLKLHL
jgi:hypothetical protein